MSKEEQDKKMSQVISDAAGAKPAGELSEKDLAGVAGGVGCAVPSPEKPVGSGGIPYATRLVKK